MKEFEALKQKISNRTRTVGSIVATYLLVTVDGEAALCALYGMAFSYIYLQWLFWDIDRVKGTDVVWSVEARKIELPMLRSLAQLAAALRQSLQPRLAVVVAMAASVAWYNQAFPETPLPTFYEGCVLLGFLSYKVRGAAPAPALHTRTHTHKRHSTASTHSCTAFSPQIGLLRRLHTRTALSTPTLAPHSIGPT